MQSERRRAVSRYETNADETKEEAREDASRFMHRLQSASMGQSSAHVNDTFVPVTMAFTHVGYRSVHSSACPSSTIIAFRSP